MRPIERAARAIVDALPFTMMPGDGPTAVDAALLWELRRALATEAYQRDPASEPQVATWSYRHASMSCGGD